MGDKLREARLKWFISNADHQPLVREVFPCKLMTNQRKVVGQRGHK